MRFLTVLILFCVAGLFLVPVLVGLAHIPEIANSDARVEWALKGQDYNLAIAHNMVECSAVTFFVWVLISPVVAAVAAMLHAPKAQPALHRKYRYR